MIMWGKRETGVIIPVINVEKQRERIEQLNIHVHTTNKFTIK